MLSGMHRRVPTSHTAAAIALALLAAAAQARDPEAAPQTVVVTATRHAMLALDAPAALSVVTRRDIEARAADNVLDALRGETGISLQGRAVAGRKVLSLRGMDSKHTLFLLNGQRLPASDGVVGSSDFQYDWIAVEDIERIEVVRGPMSVLYGSEALGGVVNLITREPGERWRGSAHAEGSHVDGGRGGAGHRVAARADGPLAAGLALRVGVAQSRQAAVASVEDPRLSELERRDKDDAWVGLGWRVNGAQRLLWEHRAGREERFANARERNGRRRYHETVNQIERSVGTLDWSAQWHEALSTQLRAYGSSMQVQNRRSEGVAPNPTQQLDERVLEGQAHARRGAQSLTGGFEARNEALEDPGLPGGRSSARHRAVFLQDEFAFGRDLHLTLGLRRDDHQSFGSEWSPRAYAVWRVDPRWTLKGGFSHGFKAPNLKQIVPGPRQEGPNLFLGNPALQPESSNTIELGLGYDTGATQLQAMLFDQRVDELIDIRLVAAGSAPGLGTYTYENLARARLRGLEAGLVQRLGAGWRGQLSYTHLDARNGSGQPLDRRPRHSATARLDWEQGAWRAGLYAEFSGSQRLPAAGTGAPSQAVPAVTMAGAHLSRQLSAGLRLALSVNNLGKLRLADKSALFTHAEAPRSWRLALRGHW